MPYQLQLSSRAPRSVDLLLIWGPCPSSVSQLSQNLLSRFLSNFSCDFPWVVPSHFFFIFEKMHFQNFEDFCFVFVLTMLSWDPVGAKNFKTLPLSQITFESFQTFSAFSYQWSSQKNFFGILSF